MQTRRFGARVVVAFLIPPLCGIGISWRTCFGRGRLFLRFRVSAFILGYRMRARFCCARDLSFLASREYISRERRRVLGPWFVARSAVPDTRNAGISRRYLRNNYEFFKRPSRPTSKVVRGATQTEKRMAAFLVCCVSFTRDKFILYSILKEVSEMCISLVCHLFGRGERFHARPRTSCTC